MSTWHPMPRRAFLRGAGAVVALPWLESLRPRRAFADAPRGGAPLRMAFLYVPNGAHMKDWTPTAVGAGFALPWILEPLAPVKDDVLVLSGLAQAKANANGDGPGDHARAAATFLTSAQAYKTNGANLRVGVSVDQVAARRVGSATRFRSLEIGCERGAQAGDCDSGYSCAYSSNLSWGSESTPLAKEVDPRLVFERLFTDDDANDTPAERDRRRRARRSVLDLVLEEGRRLHARLGTSDRRKVDEYLTGVRELELRLERAAGSGAPGGALPPRPEGVPADWQEHVRLMADLLVLAFQGDVTRVATFMLANEGSNRSYPAIGAPGGHHENSHHGGDPEKQERVRTVNRFHVAQYAYLLERLKAVQEGEGTLLDHSMVLYGSGIGDGNRHNHDDLPILLAGKGGGALRPGRHLAFARSTPLANLYVSMLEAMGVPTDRFGDSTGRLAL
jgi:hypothetical protein